MAKEQVISALHLVAVTSFVLPAATDTLDALRSIADALPES